jgi:hypothetical protein
VRPFGRVIFMDSMGGVPFGRVVVFRHGFFLFSVLSVG